MARPAVGELIRDWRLRRRRSQLDLSIEVGVSTRHLSFVETGRSRPSPELVLAIAHHLEVPLRERNSLLLAAGYAPRFSQRSLDDAEMAPMRASVQRLLDAHQPYPGVVIDRQWNVLLANDAAVALLTGVPPELMGPPLNVYRASLHPNGLAARTLNFTDWAAYLVQQLRRSATITGDPALEALLAEVLAYPNVAQIRPLLDLAEWDDPPLLVPFRFASPLGEVSLFTTLTTFGTPRDVTLDELAIELFYPADDRSDRLLRDLADASPSVRGAATR
ncbi:MAG: helix-turn-helix transcriptional regulator [Actinomycetota bacterium]|nr:helix-turn-helix transcriptional regulator [Actinomycetota bacterium]